MRVRRTSSQSTLKELLHRRTDGLEPVQRTHVQFAGVSKKSCSRVSPGAGGTLVVGAAKTPMLSHFMIMVSSIWKRLYLHAEPCTMWRHARSGMNRSRRPRP